MILRFLRTHVHSFGDARLLAESLQISLQTKMLLWRAPLRAVLCEGRSARGFSEAEVLKVAVFTDALARRLSRHNPCIHRAASLYRLLRRHGHPVSFHVGLRKDLLNANSNIHGHAWLSLDGRPCLEPATTRLGDYCQTFQYPAAGNELSSRR